MQLIVKNVKTIYAHYLRRLFDGIKYPSIAKALQLIYTNNIYFITEVYNEIRENL